MAAAKVFFTGCFYRPVLRTQLRHLHSFVPCLSETMREENRHDIKGVVDEILKSRDVLCAITGGNMAATSSHETGNRLLTREDVRNECESVKLDAAKGVSLTHVRLLSATSFQGPLRGNIWDTHDSKSTDILVCSGSAIHKRHIA